MPKNTTNSVEAYLSALKHPRKSDIETVRSIIRSVDKRIREEVKWNAPSFALEDHFATMKLQPANCVQVVLHTGAKVKSNAKAMTIDDPQGLCKWAAKDRCLITFADAADIKVKKAAFVKVLKQWIEQL